MTSEPPRMIFPRRLWSFHPLSAFLILLAAVLMVGLGTAAYLIFLDPLLGLPGASPFPAVVIGLAGGFLLVAWERWRVRRGLDGEARAIAFRERRLARVALVVIPLMAIYAAVFAGLYLLCGPFAGMTVLLALAAVYLPCVFLHRTYAPIYERARQLLLQAAAMPVERGPLPDSRRRRRVFRTLDALGVLSIVGFLALAAWLQWGIPLLAEREPKQYESEMQAGGLAVRLTYGRDAGAPAVSSDGRLVAYVRDIPLGYAQLWVMRADGGGKRRVGADTGPAPSIVWALRWSPDGSKILVVGEQRRPIKNPLEPVEYTSVYDLWTVEVATGAARRLTRDGGYIAGIWLPAARKIAAVRREDERRGERVLLMDERGGHRREVAGLSGAASAIQSWRAGRAVIVVGRDDSAGIWSVDADSAAAARLSNIPARFALPLDDHTLVFGAPGQAYPPIARATSIGLLDTGTGEVRWVLRDIQGLVEKPCLVRKPAALLFVLDLDRSADMWALPLRSRKLRRIACEQHIWAIAPGPGARVIYYAGSDRADCNRSRLWSLGWAIWRLTPSRRSAGLKPAPLVVAVSV